MLTRTGIPRAIVMASLAAVVLSVALVLAPATATAQQIAQGDDDANLITPSSVGPAVVGSTLTELTDQLGSEFEVGDQVRITVDFDGHVVTRDGSVEFRAVRASEPDDELSLFIISGDTLRTAEGVGPGTTIEEAEEIYGDATLTWDPDQEGREFVSFENQPEGRIQFRTPGIAGTNVGIYEDDEFETNEYEDGATIAAIWISCVPGDDCPDASAAGAAADDTDDDEAPGNTDEGPGDDDDAEADEEADATTDDDAEADDDADAEADEEADAATDDDADEEADAATDDDAADDPAEAEDPATELDRLPNTGATEIVLLTVAALLMLIGGALATIQRRYLAPSWLR